jgi:GNAT superfamily N-acetyltransferase
MDNESSGQHTWVAEEHGRIVGFAIAGPSRDADASPDTGEVGAIYLRRDGAGRGVGRALFAHTVAELWRDGFRQATLWVLDTNLRARRFYEAAGWAPDGAIKLEERPGFVMRELRYRVSAPRDTP